MDLSTFLVTVVTLFVAGYLYVKKKFQYWEERGVPYVKPEFPYGNLKGIGTTTPANEMFPKIYKQFKGKVLFGGMYFFTQPVVIAVDLEFIRNIFIRDFQYFTDRALYMNEKDDPLSGNIFALPGQRWKNLRIKFSPTFSSGKIKMMQETINAVAKELQNYLEPIAQRSEVVEIKDILARFTTDVIGSCAFGVECNSLKDPDAEFRRIGKRVFEYTKFELLQIFFVTIFPNLGRILRLKINKVDVSEFFMRILKETTEYREKNNIKRNDFLLLLMQIMKTGKLEGDDTELGKLTFNELAAQTFIFFGAGYETSSTTMTFLLYELAQHQDIQDRAREEVNKVLAKYNGEFTYDACMEMKYIDQILNETMRKYPIMEPLSRVCVKDYTVPGTKHVIEKGTAIAIPVHGIHYDPDIYPDPHKFDPDRFTEENIKKRHPCAWLPFGEGPRICLGLRFGMMQMRVGLAHILSKYRVKTSSKTQIPYIADPHTNILTPKGGMWLKLENL
ncbi:cytochrome P450 6a9-like [Lutzomyia longipalpis]|uniref:cytochrome P450 6a9-like n=1 Tax=Lutzomyia longipalpis TaxID=7200 RepID=UPI002483D5BF|nr:cytochrome P450 6a9-like [Lutzomyia longipalpis]